MFLILHNKTIEIVKKMNKIDKWQHLLQMKLDDLYDVANFFNCFLILLKDLENDDKIILMDDKLKLKIVYCLNIIEKLKKEIMGSKELSKYQTSKIKLSEARVKYYMRDMLDIITRNLWIIYRKIVDVKSLDNSLESNIKVQNQILQKLKVFYQLMEGLKLRRIIMLLQESDLGFSEDVKKELDFFKKQLEEQIDRSIEEVDEVILRQFS